MDEIRFDTLTASLSVLPSRRAALRLLGVSLVGGLFANRGVAPARAQQRPDRDGDGLYDDDEEEVYFTDPDVYDTDGDGAGDGEEIYNRDQGLDGPSDPLMPDGSAPPAEDGEGVPPTGPIKGLREVCTMGVDVCSAPLQCGTPTTRHTCSGTVFGVSAWCCVPPGGSCSECDCCGNFYCAYDDNNVPTCQPNPEG